MIDFPTLTRLNIAARQAWLGYQALKAQAPGTQAIDAARAAWEAAEARFDAAFEAARSMPQEVVR